MRLFFLGFVLTLSACDMAHLGNPVMWPAMVVGNAAQNTSYNARRTRVEAHVNAHHGDILNEIENGGGPALSQGMNLARVPKQTRPEVLRILKKDIAKFSPDTGQSRKMLVVWLMMHGR